MLSNSKDILIVISTRMNILHNIFEGQGVYTVHSLHFFVWQKHISRKCSLIAIVYTFRLKDKCEFKGFDHPKKIMTGYNSVNFVLFPDQTFKE